MTTADEIQMQMKIACDKLGLSAKDMAKALNTIQPMSTSADIWKPYTEWTKWRKTISIWPRKSINGKIIFGGVNKRGRTYNGPHGEYRNRQFATNKELFEARLKGVA